MTIEIQQINEPIICRFTKYLSNTKRMYMQNNDLWYPSVGWCPHRNIGSGECRDCSLVLEDEL